MHLFGECMRRNRPRWRCSSSVSVQELGFFVPCTKLRRGGVATSQRRPFLLQRVCTASALRGPKNFYSAPFFTQLLSARTPLRQKNASAARPLRDVSCNSSAFPRRTRAAPPRPTKPPPPPARASLQGWFISRKGLERRSSRWRCESRDSSSRKPPCRLRVRLLPLRLRLETKGLPPLPAGPPARSFLFRR